MDVQVAVVGGGVMGLATGFALDRAGVDSVVLERFDLGHGHGSSHGATRIFRFLYDDPTYVRMAQATLPYWEDLGVLEMTGGLQIDTARRLARTESAMRECGADVERVPPDVMREHFGWIDPDGLDAISVPDMGILAADEALRRLATNVQPRTAVDAIELVADGVRLVTASGLVSARTCVVAAGAWARDLLAPLGVVLDVVVTREQVLYFAADTEPMVPFVHGKGHWIYSIPRDGRVKVAEHHTGATTTPDERSFDLDEAGAERVSSYVRTHLPFVDPEPIGYETCLYTTTSTQDFVIDRCGPIVVVSPCSGHGFKFAPLIGEMAACLATDREPPFPVDRFGLDRQS